MSELAQARPSQGNPLLVGCASAGTLAGGFALMAQRTLESLGAVEGALAMAGEARAAIVAMLLVTASAVWIRAGRGRAVGVTLLGFGIGVHGLSFAATVAANSAGWGEALGYPAGVLVVLAVLVHLGTGSAAAIGLWRGR